MFALCAIKIPDCTAKHAPNIFALPKSQTVFIIATKTMKQIDTCIMPKEIRKQMRPNAKIAMNRKQNTNACDAQMNIQKEQPISVLQKKKTASKNIMTKIIS